MIVELWGTCFLRLRSIFQGSRDLIDPLTQATGLHVPGPRDAASWVPLRPWWLWLLVALCEYWLSKRLDFLFVGLAGPSSCCGYPGFLPYSASSSQAPECLLDRAMLCLGFLEASGGFLPGVLTLVNIQLCFWRACPSGFLQLSLKQVRDLLSPLTFLVWVLSQHK